MKFVTILIGVFIALFLSSCTERKKTVTAVEPTIILKDFQTWYAYYNNHINLTQDFIAFDSNVKKIDKGSFLQVLSRGGYIPVETGSDDSLPSYKLYKLQPEADTNIGYCMKTLAYYEYLNYKMEGKQMPDFSFTDVDGKMYNKVNTKDKLLILKCWFIHCVACVQEMPELNKVVESYKNRNDILFVSLASDSKKALKDFLTKTDFHYAVVPDQRSYMKDSLGLVIFPTHIVVNRDGIIVKVSSNCKNMISFLKREALK